MFCCFGKTIVIFERYWIIEDDVEYTGDFGELINSLNKSNAHLLATHLRALPEGWDYTDRFVEGDRIGSMPPSRRVCFLPFFAISNRALKAIDSAYSRGWAGHHEMTWPAILDQLNLNIQDIGGCGPYVANEDRNRRYLDLSPTDYRKLGSFGTMQIRLWPGKQTNILWHPVKYFPDWLVMKRKRYLSLVGWFISRCIKFVLNNV